ncbi:MAG TPA: hypothetical protein VGJ34_04150 [Gaiellaceae bacterium]|jgi:hypothetical protein
MMTPEYAYIDAGSGSMILQAIVGGVAAALVFAKFWWRRLLEFLHIRKPGEVEAAPVRLAEEASSTGNGERAAEQRSDQAAQR